MDKNIQAIINYIQENPSCSSKQVHDGIPIQVGYATVKRILKNLNDDDLIITEGRGRGTTYSMSPFYDLIRPIDMDEYFMVEIDDREIKENFNLELIPNILADATIFTKEEEQALQTLQGIYSENIKDLNDTQYSKELERLAIDLSWKSSQIEGNTYSLLETERLLKEKETAAGKSKEEAIMLLNHKEAIDFIIENPTYLDPLVVSRIEDIHSILIKDLGVDRNVRIRRIGISGTNYKPLDIEYQIRDALQQMCTLINNKKSIFEKAFLSLILLSYIQAFNDGNKRTARIVSNAILMNNGHCPISFRTVNSIDYKKAMLIFYEQNNISAFKDIFIQQYEFAVRTYF